MLERQKACWIGSREHRWAQSLLCQPKNCTELLTMICWQAGWRAGCRVRTMLRLAMKAIPLRHDDVPLDVLFEDEHLLAVNKPPGVLTAPKHRYAVRAAVATSLHQDSGFGIEVLRHHTNVLL